MANQYEEHIPEEEIEVPPEPVYEPVNSFNEAPSSWNIKYYMAGFECMLTLRDMSGTKLLGKAQTAISKLQAAGAIPVRVNGSAPVAQPALQNYAPNTPQQQQHIYTPPSGVPAGAPLVPAPAPAAPKADVETEWVKVESIAHAVTDSGHHYIKVKGGKYSKYGVKAWAESMPEIAAGYVEWPIGTEYGPLAGMEYVLVADGKKVQRFSSTQA